MIADQLPNFTQYGYEVTDLLQKNVYAGRITYKAKDTAAQELVVIKQFSFATKSWDGYKEIEREIEVLKNLDYPKIPKFIGTFDPGDGLCLVQEYIDAPPLSKRRSFSTKDIKSIATQVLKVLIYLQEQTPSIYHQDIKPENILVSEKQSFNQPLEIHLIDFGLARIGNHTLKASSYGGTPGFTPIEQEYGQITDASDLYGLGVTLICLMTDTKSVNVVNLVNFSRKKIDFKDRVSKYSYKFVEWVEKMVEPDPNKRYPNAKSALEALQPLYVMHVPEIDIDRPDLRFVAKKIGQKITKTITISNRIREATLEGSISVAPHPSDPPHTPTHHEWIHVSTPRFKGNQIQCRVTVDTNRLQADKIYERRIVVRSNAQNTTYPIRITVKTSPLPILREKISLIFMRNMVLLLLLVSSITWLNGTINIASYMNNVSYSQALLIAEEELYQEIPTLKSIDWFDFNKKNEKHELLHQKRKKYQEQLKPQIIADRGNTVKPFTILGMLTGIVFSLFSFLFSSGILNSILFDSPSDVIIFVITFLLFGFFGHFGVSMFVVFILSTSSTFLLFCTLFKIIYERYGKIKFGHKNRFIFYRSKFELIIKNFGLLKPTCIFTSIGSGFSITTAIILGTVNPLIITPLVITGGSFIATLLYPAYQNRKAIAQYRKQESRYLIKP